MSDIVDSGDSGLNEDNDRIIQTDLRMRCRALILSMQ